MEAFAMMKIAKRQKAMEEARLLEEHERSKVGKRVMSKDEQHKLNQLFGIPDSPVGLASTGRGASASLWWSLEAATADVSIEPYVIYEIGLGRDLVENWKMV